MCPPNVIYDKDFRYGQVRITIQVAETSRGTFFEIVVGETTYPMILRNGRFIRMNLHTHLFGLVAPPNFEEQLAMFNSNRDAIIIEDSISIPNSNHRINWLLTDKILVSEEGTLLFENTVSHNNLVTDGTLICWTDSRAVLLIKIQSPGSYGVGYGND